MECIDQEGHQLPTTGQTISTMPSASPLFNNTLLWPCGEGVGEEEKSDVKKPFGLSGARKHSLYVSVTHWSWPVSGLIRRYGNDNPQCILTIATFAYGHFKDALISAAKFAMLIDLLPYRPWQSVPDTFACIWRCVPSRDKSFSWLSFVIFHQK